MSLEGEGLITRVGGGDDGTQTWRWAAVALGTVESKSASAGTSDASTPNQRLRPGELRARVLEFVRARPREELSPTGVARALNASAGAVSNALERLVQSGDVVRKADSPRRFSAASKRQ